MGETRRLAAILAVDVEGYSRLMGEDEVGTLRAVQAHREAARPIIREKGGRIVKTMGDGLLLEFPSVVDAVACAIALQALMAERNADVVEGKRIVYRIGVHLGDVLVEGDDIYGDGVNIAARLEGVCEPGGVCLSEDAQRQVRGRIAADFLDMGEMSLKNIARPLRAFAIRPADPHRAAAMTHAQGEARVSILVLPFVNLSADAELDSFVDGVSESLTTDLARTPGSRVIARNTAFALKGKAQDVKQLGRDLNVLYVLEGSAQRSGDRVRINAQLIETRTGAHVWAERFEKPMGDVFAMQDEIVVRISNQLLSAILEVEARRVPSRASLDLLDYLYKAGALLYRSMRPEDLRQARVLAERALELDSDNLLALQVCVTTDLGLLNLGAVEDRGACERNVEATLTKVLQGSPNDARSLMLMGILYTYTRRAALGVALLERALRYDSNLVQAHAQMGAAQIMLGKAELAEGHIEEALRLSPQDNLAYLWYFVAGDAQLYLGEYEAGAAWLRRSINANRNWAWSNFSLAACLAQLGDLNGAHVEVQAGLALHPEFTLRRYCEATPSDSANFLAQRARVIDGMRLAGVPE